MNEKRGPIEHYVLFVPRQTLVCERILKDQGVFGSCNISEFHLNLVPFDSDVMSMEMHSAFRENQLLGDRTSLFYAANAVMQLQVQMT